MLRRDVATIHMYPGENIPTWGMTHGHQSPEWVFYQTDVLLLEDDHKNKIINDTPEPLFSVLNNYIRPFHQIGGLPFTHYYSPNLATSGFENGCDVSLLTSLERQQIEEYMVNILSSSTSLWYGILHLIDSQIRNTIVLGDIINKIEIESGIAYPINNRGKARNFDENLKRHTYKNPPFHDGEHIWV